MSDNQKYKVYESNLDEFKPDPKNHNKHTLRGHKMVTNSMQNRGYARPGFAANDGTVLGGNLSTMEIAPSLGIGDGKVIVVETDGTIPIIHKRTDIAPNSTEARQLSYEDNFTSHFSFDLDPAVTMADIEAGFDFETIDISLPDLGEMLKGAISPDFQPVDADTQPRLDRKSPITCPLCGGEFEPKMTELKVDFCDHKAAEWAVKHWHYSKTMPIGKLVKFGVWENGQFVGAVIFARGNSPTLGNAYGLKQVEVCELVRIALTRHQSPVSQIGVICIKLLKKHNPDLRLIISFADPAEGHNGAIYQAMNWVYTGESSPSWQWLHNGEWKHNREITSGAFGRGGAIKDYKVLPKRLPLGKHRYLYPLDRAMRKQIAPLAKPYPKKEDMRPAEGGNLATSEAGRFDSDQAAFNSPEHIGLNNVL